LADPERIVRRVDQIVTFASYLEGLKGPIGIATIGRRSGF
jgi:hypothetical protein